MKKLFILLLFPLTLHAQRYADSAKKYYGLMDYYTLTHNEAQFQQSEDRYFYYQHLADSLGTAKEAKKLKRKYKIK